MLVYDKLMNFGFQIWRQNQPKYCQVESKDINSEFILFWQDKFNEE